MGETEADLKLKVRKSKDEEILEGAAERGRCACSGDQPLSVKETFGSESE